METVLFIVFPYVAVTLAIGVGLHRYLTGRYTYSSLSSQLLENRKLFWGSVPWHYGITLILLAHLLAWLFPGAAAAILGNGIRLFVFEAIGLALALFAALGVILLIIRRLPTDSRARAVTSGMDWVLLLVLLIQVFTGIGVALFDRWGSLWYLSTAVPWLWSLIKFQPEVSTVTALPALIQFHLVWGFLIILLFPFSRLVHIFTIPLEYLWRPYQVVVWYRDPRRGPGQAAGAPLPPVASRLVQITDRREARISPPPGARISRSGFFLGFATGIFAGLARPLAFVPMDPLADSSGRQNRDAPIRDAHDEPHSTGEPLTPVPPDQYLRHTGHIGTPADISRRSLFSKLGILAGAIAAGVVVVPSIWFLLGLRKAPMVWLGVGKVSDFNIGETIEVSYADPSSLPWAGVTAKTAAWLRRVSADQFIAFSINCTHLGCPVRWLPGAELFMCPCHGGVFYSDGTVASGPPPKPLVTYPVRLNRGTVEILASPLPITTHKL